MSGDDMGESYPTGLENMESRAGHWASKVESWGVHGKIRGDLASAGAVVGGSGKDGLHNKFIAKDDGFIGLSGFVDMGRRFKDDHKNVALMHVYDSVDVDGVGKRDLLRFYFFIDDQKGALTTHDEAVCEVLLAEGTSLGLVKEIEQGMLHPRDMLKARIPGMATLNIFNENELLVLQRAQEIKSTDFPENIGKTIRLMEPKAEAASKAKIGMPEEVGVASGGGQETTGKERKKARRQESEQNEQGSNVDREKNGEKKKEKEQRNFSTWQQFLVYAKEHGLETPTNLTTLAEIEAYAEGVGRGDFEVWFRSWVYEKTISAMKDKFSNSMMNVGQAITVTLGNFPISITNLTDVFPDSAASGDESMRALGKSVVREARKYATIHNRYRVVESIRSVLPKLAEATTNMAEQAAGEGQAYKLEGDDWVVLANSGEVEAESGERVIFAEKFRDALIFYLKMNPRRNSGVLFRTDLIELGFSGTAVDRVLEKTDTQERIVVFSEENLGDQVLRDGGGLGQIEWKKQVKRYKKDGKLTAEELREFERRNGKLSEGEIALKVAVPNMFPRQKGISSDRYQQARDVMVRMLGGGVAGSLAEDLAYKMAEAGFEGANLDHGAMATNAAVKLLKTRFYRHKYYKSDRQMGSVLNSEFFESLALTYFDYLSLPTSTEQQVLLVERVVREDNNFNDAIRELGLEDGVTSAELVDLSAEELVALSPSKLKKHEKIFYSNLVKLKVNRLRTRTLRQWILDKELAPQMRDVPFSKLITDADDATYGNNIQWGATIFEYLDKGSTIPWHRLNQGVQVNPEQGDAVNNEYVQTIQQIYKHIGYFIDAHTLDNLAKMIDPERVYDFKTGNRREVLEVTKQIFDRYWMGVIDGKKAKTLLKGHILKRFILSEWSEHGIKHNPNATLIGKLRGKSGKPRITLDDRNRMKAMLVHGVSFTEGVVIDGVRASDGDKLQLFTDDEVRRMFKEAGLIKFWSGQPILDIGDIIALVARIWNLGGRR